MDALTALVSLLVLLGTLYYWLLQKRPKNFPPGPKGIPLFGNAFSLGPQGHKAALELGKIYGDVVGLLSGSYKCIYINELEDIREALNKPEFAGRGYNVFLDLNSEDVNAGLIMSYGSTWVEHRRFTLRTLRDFGFGKRSFEHIIQEEVEGLMEQLKKTEGQPMSTQSTFNIAAFNIIWSIVAGQRFPLNHPKLQELITLLNDFFQTSFQGIIILNFLFPAFVRFRNRFPFLFPQKRKIFREKLFDFLRQAVVEHRATYEEGTPARDFIDAYMQEEKKNEGNPDSSFKHDEDDFRLIVTLFDLFAAGGETTSTSMSWAFLILANHPEVQEKIYAEILKIGASDRPVALADRQNMIYTEAAIAELFRFSTITPISVPHAVTEDTTFKGYSIPKGTIVFPNVWAVHFSEKIWGDPQVFRPERFLETAGGTTLKFKKNNALMPFSVGKRECLGMSLAKDEFFLFVTNSIRNFVITLPADETPHSYTPIKGLVAAPPAHRILLRSR